MIKYQMDSRIEYPISIHFRPYVQCGILALAFYIAMTRIADYMHHPWDVVTGSLLGTVMAIFTHYQVLDLSNRPLIFTNWNDDNPDFELEKLKRENREMDEPLNHSERL